MKITGNQAGNYGIYNKGVREPGTAMQTPASKEKAAAKETLSDDEKKFFAGLYPENKSDVMDYHYYGRNGKLSGVKLGSLFDKRG